MIAIRKMAGMPRSIPMEDFLRSFRYGLERLATRCIVLSIKVRLIVICISGCSPLDLLPEHGESKILLATNELWAVVRTKVDHSTFVDATEAIKVHLPLKRSLGDEEQARSVRNTFKSS